MKICQNTFFVVMILSTMTTEGTKIYPMRKAKVTIIPNSIYIPAVYKNFISKIYLIQSLSKCIYACQNNDYCRTATYSGQLRECSLYEEYSTVGQIIPSMVYDQSVLSFSFCPSDPVNEPFNVCFGTPSLQPIAIANLMAQLPLTPPIGMIPATGQAATWSSRFLTLAPMWAWNAFAMHNENDGSYSETDKIYPVSSITIIDMDHDDYSYYAQISSSSTLYITSTAFNKTIRPTPLRTVCMSDKYVVAVPISAANKTLYVYWKSNGSEAFRLAAPTSGAVSCLIVKQILFIVGVSPSPAIQSIPLNSSSMQNYTTIVPLSQCPTPARPLKIDASGRLFVPCRNGSSKSILIFTTQGTILGKLFNNIYGLTQMGIKTTKYRFSLAACNASVTSIFEF
jgi:hypothetical protein